MVLNGGIIGQAQNASTETRGAQVYEQVQLWKAENKASEYIAGSSPKLKGTIVDELYSKKLLTEDEYNTLQTEDVITIGNRTINFRTSNIEETPSKAIISETEAEDAGYIKIYTIEDLTQMSNDVAGYYILMADLNFDGVDWEPLNLSRSSQSKKMTFDGNGFRIKNLKNSLFEKMNYGTIKNVALLDVDTQSPALLRDCEFECVIQNCYVTGSFTNCSALVGTTYNSLIKNCFAIVDMSIDDGGCLVGRSSTHSRLENCYVAGDIETASKSGANVSGVFCADAQGLNALDVYCFASMTGAGSMYPLWNSIWWGDCWFSGGWCSDLVGSEITPNVNEEDWTDWGYLEEPILYGEGKVNVISSISDILSLSAFSNSSNWEFRAGNHLPNLVGLPIPNGLKY